MQRKPGMDELVAIGQMPPRWGPTRKECELINALVRECCEGEKANQILCLAAVGLSVARANEKPLSAALLRGLLG